MIFAYFDGDDIGPKLELLLLDECLEEAGLYSELVAKAVQEMRKFVQECLGGNVLLCGGDDLVASWGDQSIRLADLEQARGRFYSICGRSVSIGIGSSAREAVHNLRRAKMMGKDRVVATAVSFV